MLDKNVISGEDNKEDTWYKIKEKLKEEADELLEAIEEGDKLHIAEETFDVIQICIRSLVLLGKEKFDLQQLNRRHNKKLVNRGWKHSKIIRVFLNK